jgi:hypothetical protein
MKEAEKQKLKRSLTAALGRRFRVFIPDRAQQYHITCRKCLITWSFPTNMDCTEYRKHRCCPYRLAELSRARMRLLVRDRKCSRVPNIAAL